MAGWFCSPGSIVSQTVLGKIRNGASLAVGSRFLISSHVGLFVDFQRCAADAQRLPDRSNIHGALRDDKMARHDQVRLSVPVYVAQAIPMSI